MSKNKPSPENSPGSKNGAGANINPGTKNIPDAKKEFSVKEEKKAGDAVTSDKKSVDKKTPAKNKPAEKVIANTATSKKPVKNSGGSKIQLFISVILLVAIIVIIAGLYLFWQQHWQPQKQDQKTQSQYIATLKSDIEQYSNSQNRLRSELNNKISDETEEISLAVNHLQELAGKNHQDWALSETEYLLRVANHRLQLEGDIQTAIKALMIADGKLKNLADPSLLPVRKQLADEVSSLQSTSQPDIYGMVLALDSLQGKSVHMQLNITMPSETMNEAISNSNNEKISIKDWRRALERVWEELKTLVVIKKHDKQLAPILTTEQQQTIRHILQLKIQGIRTALLNKQPELFLLSINETLQWLRDHFSPDDPNATLLKSRLQEFMSVPLKVDLPDISGSLHALQAVQRHRKDFPSPATAPATKPEKSPEAAKDTAAQEIPE